MLFPSPPQEPRTGSYRQLLPSAWCVIKMGSGASTDLKDYEGNSTEERLAAAVKDIPDEMWEKLVSARAEKGAPRASGCECKGGVVCVSRTEVRATVGERRNFVLCLLFLLAPGSATFAAITSTIVPHKKNRLVFLQRGHLLSMKVQTVPCRATSCANEGENTLLSYLLSPNQ